MAELANRNLVILGASSDIGRALAWEALRREDSRTLLASRSLCKDFQPRREGDFQYLHGLDLTVEADLLRLRAAVQDFFDEPFSVIHSVGDFWTHKPLVETAFSEIRRMCESHYLTLAGVAYSLIPVMIKNGGGHLVAFSCNSVSYSYPDMAPFTSAKAAVESFVKCMANEYSEQGIAMTALALPTIKTDKVVIEKPHGDHANYLTSDDLAKAIINNILPLPVTINGNIVKLFKYSPSFYSSSYFERNPRRAGQ
jgi:NAD(P)-dependent dehydrogenase (short-subunit alcohol dehydrogenase family)